MNLMNLDHIIKIIIKFGLNDHYHKNYYKINLV